MIKRILFFLALLFIIFIVYRIINREGADFFVSTIKDAWFNSETTSGDVITISDDASSSIEIVEDSSVPTQESKEDQDEGTAVVRKQNTEDEKITENNIDEIRPDTAVDEEKLENKQTDISESTEAVLEDMSLEKVVSIFSGTLQKEEKSTPVIKDTLRSGEQKVPVASSGEKQQKTVVIIRTTTTTTTNGSNVVPADDFDWVIQNISEE